MMKEKIIMLLVIGILFLQCTQKNKFEVPDRNVVGTHGSLSVEGVNIVDQHGQVVVLEGMSMFWSQWISKYYNYQSIKWLRDDWHCDITRLALGTEPDGYLKHPGREKRKIKKMIDASIDLGMYALVDWHSHHAENYTNEAVEFFTEIAKEYGDQPNIIYEIYNEPLKVSWDSVVKPYLDTVITAIRKYDPDNIIIVGSPHWSQDVDKASDNPIIAENIAYSLHFYAGTHKAWLREKAEYAISNNLALWVTEFGTCNADGNGDIDFEELETWFEFMEKHQLSWCNWSVADKDETASILKPGGKRRGGWKQEDLTDSGRLIREKLRSVNK